MRTIKMIVLGLLAVVLVLLGVANMAAVDLYLLPPALAGERFSLKSVPLAAAVLAAVLVGIIVGQVLEWFRERGQRRVAEEKRREIAQLRQEVSHLRQQLGDRADDLPRLPAA
jgi:uncharacterized integral membrane protein